MTDAEPERPDRGHEHSHPWHEWSGHEHWSRGGGFRGPPWWPRDEPFPPSRSAWHGMRHRFLRRVGLFVFGFFALMFLANAAAWFLFSGGFGDGDRGPVGPPFGLIAVGLVVAFLVIGRGVRRMAAPVGDVMEAADRLSSGDYGARVQERGPPEMRRLARSFNQMAERLQTNEERRRNLLADIAHELRTPLSVIQGHAEGVLDGVYGADRAHLGPLLDETRVMSRLLDDLQMLSTAEAGALVLHRESVEPAQLVADAVAAARSQADAASVVVSERVAPGLPEIEVDPVRIGEVLANLVGNAVRHTPAGGLVTVSAAPSDGGVAFEVEDTGPGIAPDLLPHVFERFVKADSGGAGLGLAIARTLVEAHGGQITAHSEQGRGTRMRVVLPVSSQAP